MSLLNISKYARIWPNKQDSEYAFSVKYAKIVNTVKFSIWQGSKYMSVTQHSEYSRTWFDRVLNVSWVLNMPGF